MSTGSGHTIENGNASAHVAAEEPKVTKKQKSFSKEMSNAVDVLNRMANKHHAQYVLLVADKDMNVTQKASTDARLFLERVDAADTLPSAICLSRMDRSMLALSRSKLTFSELPRAVRCKLVMHILKKIMPKRKQSHPFDKTSQEQVTKDYPWWPAEIPYQHPQTLEDGQLVKLVKVIVQSHSRERLQKCLTSLHAMGLSAKDEEAAKIALNRAFAGDAACVAPSSTLQLVSVPTESMLVYVGDVPYLGARGATDDDIATCLTAHGIKSKGIQNGAVRMCGTDVKLVDLYNAIATHGGPAEEAPAQKLLEVATVLSTDTTVSDWRTQYRRSFYKYLQPLLVPGPEAKAVDGEQGHGASGADAGGWWSKIGAMLRSKGCAPH